MGQPLHGVSHYNRGEQLGRIWNSDNPVPEKIWQSVKEGFYTVPDALQRKLAAQVRTGVRPASEGDVEIDAVEGSPLGAVTYGATKLLGGSDKAQRLALDLGSAADGLLQAGSALRGRAPLYTGAQRPPDAEVVNDPSMVYRLDRSRLGPTEEDVNALVKEHSKQNLVPLTPAGARAIFDQTQPPWTSVELAGDNVPGADIRYPGSSGTQTQVKAVANPSQFEKRVRKELGRGGSPVVAVQVPEGTNPEQLKGKLRSNFSNHDVGGRSIVVVDTKGKVLIDKQPFPAQGEKK